jgi:hypothetical protein
MEYFALYKQIYEHVKGDSENWPGYGIEGRDGEKR